MLHAPPMRDGKRIHSYPEAYEHAQKRQEKTAGKGRKVPDELFDTYLRDRLGIGFAEWTSRMWCYREIMLELAYQDGVALAQWVADNPHTGAPDG